METRYVCTYFNWNGDDRRRQLCQEFLNRYPWVTLLEVGRSELICDNRIGFNIPSGGFIDYVLINLYLRDNKGINLVVIDSDLILDDNFRKEMEGSINKYGFVHGFETAFMEGEDDPIVSSLYSNPSYGHTGYVYGFSNQFLEAIDYKFPEDFIYGGFDYILAMILLKKPLKLIERFTFYDSLKIFKKRIENLSFTYLRGIIVRHNFHGHAYMRRTPFNLYT